MQSTTAEARAIRKAQRNALSLFRPPPRLTLSQWADKHFRLSRVSSAEAGRFYTSRAEYQRGIMDAITDPTIESVTVMSSAQVGKTIIQLIAIGYFIHQDPSPILIVLPTVDLAKTWSKQRLAAMLRDTPALRGKVREPRARDSGNTLLEKEFPGGMLALCGANSPVGLSSRPIRIVICDEVDKFPATAGVTEGDPVNLVEARTKTFWNRKHIKVSTPSVKGISRIEDAYEESDKRVYECPCPHCNEYQELRWANLLWEKDERGRPVDVRLRCEKCGGEVRERDKSRMIRAGRWRATAPHVRGHAGFRINEMYSPWSTWERMVKAFLIAKKKPETLQEFVNEAWGETWEEQGRQADSEGLSARREDYGVDSPLPEGILLLTAGVDIQDDRIEATAWGWGLGQEAWAVEHAVFRGNPATSPLPWQDLDDWLQQSRVATDGVSLHVAAACIDSGGHATDQVYKFCRKREHRRVWPIVGRGGAGLPLISLATRRNRAGVILGTVGVDTAKDLLFARLGVEEFGPGYVHFPRDMDDEWFKQLASEKKVTKRTKGNPVQVWKRVRARNEALDCAVYAVAAFASLNANLEKISRRRDSKTSRVEQPDTAPPDGAAETVPAAPQVPHVPQATVAIRETPAQRAMKQHSRRFRGGFVQRY